MDRSRKPPPARSHSIRNMNPSNDEMLKQAVYNTGANVFVVLAGFGIVALYWVLESFFRPLMWAMLCGAFLHPFKYRLTRKVKNWLEYLESAGTPFAIGVLIVPINILDSSSEQFIKSVRQRWRVIGIVVLVFSALYITYLQAPMDFRQFTALLWNLFVSISNIIGFFNFKWVSHLEKCRSRVQLKLKPCSLKNCATCRYVD